VAQEAIRLYTKEEVYRIIFTLFNKCINYELNVFLLDLCVVNAASTCR
jgi:hypothetical protein